MAYWVLTLALIVLGVLTGFSIGPFLLVIALAMVVLGPFRRRPFVFWPLMVGAVGFVIGYLTVAPFWCSATAAIPGGTSATVCSSLAGIQYAGSGLYDPPRLPGLVAAIACAAVAGVLVFAAMRLTRRSHPPSPDPS